VTRLAETSIALLLAATAIAFGRGEDGDRTAEKTEPVLHLIYHHGGSVPKSVIRIAGADGEDPRTLTKGIQGVLSPDGRLVVYSEVFDQGYAGAVFVIPTGSGNPQRLIQRLYQYGWSPDSRYIVAALRNKLVRIDVATHAIVVLDAMGNIYRGWSFSPSGRLLVYSRAPQQRSPRCEEQADLYVVPLSGGPRKQLTRNLRATSPVWAGGHIRFDRQLRAGKSCRVTRWQIRPDGSGLLMRKPPPVPGTWRSPRVVQSLPRRRLLVSFETRWGTEMGIYDQRTKRSRRLYGYAGDVSKDGRFLLGTTSGPDTRRESVAIVPLDGGRPRVIALGPVCCAEWNR
jgi:hypothetical protein